MTGFARVKHNITFFRSAVAACLLALAAQGQAATYTVKSGDTLWRIAHNHGSTVETVRRINGLKGNTVQPGQRLQVPAGKTVAYAPAAKAPAYRPAPHANASAVVGFIDPSGLRLASSSAMVVDAQTGETIYAKNATQAKPIASITKLMTAMVALDAQPSLQEVISISNADIDHLKHTTSRLPIGTKMTRYEMLRLALMSSENRASSALSRHYPGGRPAFIAAMNAKARQLGMHNTRFQDATGLTPANVSTAEDLVKMVKASSQYDLIRQFTTTSGREVALRPHSAPLQFNNSNALVRSDSAKWDIKVSKTGYINEAGRCLVMMANVGKRPAVMVFLESNGKLSPVGDANRVKGWMEVNRVPQQLASR
jgi:D-alanyl-D-alanine endopeptidase (penicillin-binding protein 7)